MTFDPTPRPVSRPPTHGGPDPTAARPRIALATRDVAPAQSGGIAAYAFALVDALVPWADVVLFTREANLPAIEAARSGDSPWTLPGRAQVVGVPDFGDREQGSYFSPMHRYAAALYERMAEHYDGAGPDLIEVPDYHGEGCVLVQARAAGVPWLQDTLVAVRVHTSAEIVSVLNGAIPDDPRLRVLHELERFSLQQADACLVGGGDVGGLYRRFYDGRLAPVLTVRHPVPEVVRTTVPALLPESSVAAGRAAPGPGGRHLESGGAPSSAAADAPPAPLRLLYAGRLERRKGVLRLVEELRKLRADWRLTILGADTETGPLGLPVAELLRLAVADDGRITIVDELAPEAVPALIADHDVVVVPSLWECWPNAALEALAAGVPVLASPVGGLVEIVGPSDGTDRPGGWLARDASPTALRERLERLVGDPDDVRRPERRTAARAQFDALTDPDVVRRGYEELLARPRRRGAVATSTAAASTGLVAEAPGPTTPAPVASPPPAPRVTVVVPYFRLHRFVTEAVDSALAQTHRNVQVVVVCDGSFDEDDVVLRELAIRPRVAVLYRANGGLGSARNAGIAVSTGPFVLPLDADNVLHPTFVERCLALLHARPELSYATSWSRYVEEDGTPFQDPASAGWQPLTNDTRLLEERNLAGDAVALFRRRVFDDGLRYDAELTSFEDWLHYLLLRDRGRLGVAIPERLFDYRVRASSMLRELGEPSTARLMQEMRARQREQEVEWCPWNA